MWRKLTMAAALLAALAGGVYAVRMLTAPEQPESTAGNSASAEAAMIALGQRVYRKYCASCHGGNLEGQPNWRTRKADGKLPAPPHDASGHTWHHSDALLFRMIKRGTASLAPAGYKTDMPAYAGILTDSEIRAVITFIKNRWPADIRRRQAAMNRR
jgi:mono/diheme cytochrome c family protein